MPTLPPSHSTPGIERLTVRASIGVQTRDGLNFGKLVWIEGTRLYVQVDATLVPLELVTMRADLSPAPGTALLEGEVMRVLPGTANEPQGYLIRVKKVNEGDEPRWQQFLRVKQGGGTLRELSDVRDSTGALASTYSGIAERERKAAADRIRGGAGTSTWSSSQPTEQGGGRAAMRDALRAAMKGEAAPDMGPEADRTVSPVRSGSSGSVSPTRSLAPGVAAAAEDPTWMLSAIAGRNYLQVTWRGAEAFGHHANTQLVSGVFTLTSDGRTLPSTPPIHMVLRYESLVLQCGATAIRSLPLSVTYRLDLSVAQIADIRRMARPPTVGAPR